MSILWVDPQHSRCSEIHQLVHFVILVWKRLTHVSIWAWFNFSALYIHNRYNCDFDTQVPSNVNFNIHFTRCHMITRANHRRDQNEVIINVYVKWFGLCWSPLPNEWSYVKSGVQTQANEPLCITENSTILRVKAIIGVCTETNSANWCFCMGESYAVL